MLIPPFSACIVSDGGYTSGYGGSEEHEGVGGSVGRGDTSMTLLLCLVIFLVSVLYLVICENGELKSECSGLRRKLWERDQEGRR